MENTYYEGANERILARVPAEARRILDVGCAAGRLGEIIKANGAIPSGHLPLANYDLPEKEVWGIEAVPSVAQEAKRRLDHVIVGDVEAMDPLPLPERYFDCVICGDVLEHLKEPGVLLQRLKKHLVPGATLIVNVPNVGHWSVIAGLLQGKFEYTDSGLLDRTHFRFFTPESLKEMLWEAGYLVAEEDAHELRRFGYQFGNASRVDAAKAIGQAAASIGLDPKVAERTAAIYQQLYVAKPVPDPYTEPDKMAALVGPHIGKLGEAAKRCSVVVLTYNSMKTIETCLNSVLPTLGPEDELILVDNASQDGTPEYLKTFADQLSATVQLSASEIPDKRACAPSGRRSADKSGPHTLTPQYRNTDSTCVPPQIKLLLNEQNHGFSKGCNIGILESQGEYLILLNPDTEVWPGWIEALLAPFQDPNVGATGPLSDSVCGEQFVGPYLPRGQMTSPDALADAIYSGQSAISNLKSTMSTKLLIGFCLALRRSLLNAFGLLEEACFLGADDLELSWRLRTLGFQLAIAQNVFVAHDCGGSFNTISSEEKRNHVSASDASLLRKLQNFYGHGQLPSSRDLWGNDIFTGAMEAFKS